MNNLLRYLLLIGLLILPLVLVVRQCYLAHYDLATLWLIIEGWLIYNLGRK